MKKVYLTLTLLMISVMTFAQNWQSLLTDPAGDGSDPSLLDGTQLEYLYDSASDSLWFRISTANLNSSTSMAMGVNIMVNIPGGGSTFNFWGNQNQAAYHRLITAWVTGSAPSNYSGTVGISDASGVNAMNYASLHSNNLTIMANPNSSAKTIIIGLKRNELIPDSYFSGNTINVKTAAAVGSNQFWNDDIYQSSGGTMTITKSSTVALQETSIPSISIYPNPATDEIKIDVEKEAKFTITDLSGKVVLRGLVSANESIDITKLSSGNYILSVGGLSTKFRKS